MKKTKKHFPATGKVLKSKRGEGYVDTGVKILIAVVLGALVLTTTYALMKDTVMKTVKEKVEGMFSYSDTTPGAGNTPAEEPAEETLTEYDVMSTDDYRYGQNLNISIDSHSDKFVSVELDGEELPSTHFQLSEGMTTTFVTLNSNVTSNLSKASHSVRINYENGFAQTYIFAD